MSDDENETPNVKKGKWQKPSKDREDKRLGSADGWSLASSTGTTGRTRGKRVNVDFDALSPRRPRKLLKPFESSESASESTPSTLTPNTMEQSKEPSEGSTPTKEKKPPPKRVILEVASLKQLMEDNIRCPDCNDPVAVSFPTVCIASGCKITCRNDMCHFVTVKRPAPADAPLPPTCGSALTERSTDYEANVMFVLAFLMSGNGGKEAERLLGFLGLPNATTMEKRSFGTIEERLSPTIQAVTAELLQNNLREAVKLHYGNKQHNGSLIFDLWREQMIVENKDKEILPKHLFPKLALSADMGWQKRASGRKCDSNSGHACLVDSQTRKPVIFAVRSKICSVCTWHKGNTPVKEHNCNANHAAGESSGAMEPLAILDMVTRLYNEFFVETSHLITDDDSSIKAKLKWSNEDYCINNSTTEVPKIINRNGNIADRPNHGELPRHIPEPLFFADPNHRKKTLKGELYRKVNLPVDSRDGLTRVDIMRIATNFAYMMRTLPKLDQKDWKDAAKAVVEHHFDNHEHCRCFCNRKKLTDEQRKQTAKVCRCKQKDAKLYKYLLATIERFITDEALKEVGHGSDTLVNESLNNTISWYAPKNKTYCATSSLTNRISVALGVNSVGTEAFFLKLTGTLGINCSPDITHYLKQQQKARAHRINKSRTTKAKSERNTKLHNKLKEYSEKLKKQIAKSNGCVYEPGIGMDGGYVAAEDEPKKKKAQKSKYNGDVVCSKCKEVGHARPTNKLCKFYKPRETKKPKTVEDKQQQKQPVSADDDAPIAAEDDSKIVAEDNTYDNAAADGEPETDAADQQELQDASEQALFDEVGFDSQDEEFFDTVEDENDLSVVMETGYL